MSKQGQALVEFSLVVVVLIFIVIAMIDIGPALADILVAKQLSAVGARAAAISLANCPLDVSNSLGSPAFFFSTWTLDIPVNCTNPASLDPGEPVTVTIQLNYQPIFWQTEPWLFNLSTTDGGR